MKNKTQSDKIRYEQRNAIENIIKEHHIDRTKFHEVDKFHYEKVIRKVYYTFCDYQKHPVIQIAYMWTRFRQDLNGTDLVRADQDNWNAYIDQLDTLVPDKNPSTFYYLIVDGDWVYEGVLTEIKKVLTEYPISMEDFYLFPKDYNWLISYCEDGESMCRVWN